MKEYSNVENNKNDKEIIEKQIKMLLRAIVPTTIIFSTVAFLSCGKSGEKHLVVTGSSTIGPVLREIAARYEKKNPGLRIDIQTGGSSRGISDVRRSLADIGMVSRSANSDELDLKWHALARDGIGIIINRKNPIKSISSVQIQAIYTGRAKNWKEIGGPDAQITVVNKAAGRSTLDVFLKYFKLKNRDIKAHIVIGENQQGLKTVIGNPNAIAYISIGTAAYEESRGAAIRLLKLDGVKATLENVRNGSYPAARTLHLITPKMIAPKKSSPMAMRFVNYARSQGVHDLIRGQYFVPLQP